jgi:multisubunit Na+/H+ antiporter MnhC subunit
VAVVEWLQHFLLRESNNRRLAYGLAIAGHVIIALLLLHGFFERTEPASVATMPVEIVMEEPAAASPPPVSAPNEQNGLSNIPAVADADKRAKAPLAALNVNGVDLSKQPGHDGGDPSSAALPMPPAAGDLASGAASLPSWAVEPIGLAQRQATAHELGEDELTAIKEPKLECGAKARGPLPRARMTRQQALVIGTATAAQALAMIRSTQVRVDRHINPNYATNTEVFADTWEGKTAVVLPAGLTVNVGEMIEFDEGHVDPSNPCQYIPNLAVSKR